MVLINGVPKRKKLLLGLSLSATVLFFYAFLDSTGYNNLLVADSPVLLYRLQLWYEGKCIGASLEGRLEVIFCNPRENQYFQLLQDGRVMFGIDNDGSNGNNGKCVQLGNNGLVLGDCRSALKLVLNSNSTYLNSLEHDVKCVTPVSDGGLEGGREGLVPNPRPLSQDLVALTTCHEDASRLTLIEESSFQESRKYLLFPVLDPLCDFPACGINKAVPPVVPLPQHRIQRCQQLSRCVTVLTKTARRPLLVLRMVESMRKFEKYRNLPVIAYDDGVGEHSREIMEQIARYPNLQYIIGEEEDIGISEGRNLALGQVTTKYFLLLDDDNIFLNSTDIELLVNILDTTDATLAGGNFAGYNDFAGFLNFGYGKKHSRTLHLGHGTCVSANETIPLFPTCVRCELTSNDFLARTRDIVEVGGWSSELKTQEHKDLFVRLKAAEKKVVYCPDFQVENRRGVGKEMNVEGYKGLRHGREQQMRNLFCNRWNIHNKWIV